MKRSPLAAVTAILAAALLVFAPAAPALAHDALKSSSPAKGAVIEALDEVRLEFTSRVRMPFVIVRGPGDVQVQSGAPEEDGAVVTQAVKGPLTDGKYTIAYRVVSSDGHPLEGEIPFRVKGAPADRAEESEPAASPTPSQGVTAQPAASQPATQPASQPAASASAGEPAAPAAPSGLDADATAADQGAMFPVWLIVVVGALVGIGIGFLLSARRGKP
ncbi:MAG TPA: copper resistance CopC family protein [Nonomuraea sp.]|nr:copper resistance CopC family protein [Nonomuraea sp.]